jgi:peptide/nickel transport system substrate-binding protein
MTMQHRAIRRILALGCAMAAVTLGLTACSSTDSATSAGSSAAPQKGGNLRIALSGIPAVIDPFATSLQANWVIARQVCEPLFDVSTSFEIKPVLVKASAYDNDKTYTFTLRDGVSFQDGQPLKAADVVASLTRYLDTPGNGSILKNMTESITATDDATVVLKLKSPSAIVPTLLTTAYIMPASLVKGRPITSPLDTLVCTGPYKQTSYVKDQTVTLARWDGYKSPGGEADGGTGTKNAYADTMTFTAIPEASTRIQAVQTGQLDIGGTVSLDMKSSIVSPAKAQPLSATQGSTIVFNKVQGPMANVKLRQAFLAALNMDEIMAAGFGDSQSYTVDGSFIPAVNKQWATTAGAESYNKQDLTKAKQLMSEAGYTGAKITWLTTKDDPTWYGPSLPAQEQLKKAGFTIDLQVVDVATIIARRTHPDQYDIFSSAIPTYADPVLLPYLQSTFPGTWTSTERDTLLAQLASQTSQADRKATWEKLQTLVWKDLPFLKFGTTKPMVVTSESVHLAHVDELTGSFYNVWLG